MTDLVSMTDLEAKVREKVVTTFVALLPESAFDDLVSKAIKEYFETTTKPLKVLESAGYGGNTVKELTYQLSPFQYLVWNEMHKLAKSAIEEHFEGKREEIKRSILGRYTESSQISMFENASLELIMVRQQEVVSKLMLESALQSFKHNLSSTLSMHFQDANLGRDVLNVPVDVLSAQDVRSTLT